MSSSIEIDVSANIAKFKTAMDKAAVEGQNLNKKLDRAFKGVGRAMKAVGALAGVAVAGGLAAIGKKSIDTADNIGKLSDRIGASTEALGEYRFVTSQTGVQFETFTLGLQRATRRISEAAKGTGEAKDALKELGLDAQALNNLRPEDQFEAIASAMEGVERQSDKVRLAMKLFDTEGVALLQTMKVGAEGIKAYRDEAKELNLSLSKDQVEAAAAANDAIDKLTKSVSGSFSAAFINSSDSIARLADFMGEVLPPIINILIRGLETFGSVLSAVGSGVSNFIDAIGISTESINLNAAALEEINKLSGEQLKSQKENISARILEIESDKSLRNARGRLNSASQTELDSLREKIPLVQSALSQSRVGIVISIEQAKATLDLANANLEEAKSKAEQIRIGHAGRNARLEAKRAIEQLTDAQDGLSKQQSRLFEFDERLKNSNRELKATLDGVAGSTGTLAGKNKELEASFNTSHVEAYRKEIERLNEATGKNLIRSQSELNRVLDENTQKAANYAKAMKTASDVLINDRGLIAGTKEYNEALKVLGFEIPEVAKSTEESTSKMSDAWKNFSRGAFDSFKSFTRSTLDDFGNIKDGFKSLGDNLKNLAKDIVADLIATFASDTLKNVFQNLFSGGSGGGGGFDISSIFGGGGGSGGGGLLGSIGSLLGGNTSSAGPVQPSSIAGLLSPTGAVGGLFAQGGFFGSGGAVSTAFTNLGASIGPALSALGPIAAAAISIGIGRKLTEDITGNTGRVLGTLGGVAGGITARILDSLGIIGNARTKDELARDQLGAVNVAIQEGRTQKVALGQVNGVEVGFRGGFDENSTFFDIGGSPEIQQKVAEMLVANYGFDQARVVEDGIIRLEDFSREFSQNNDDIVNEVKASIASVSLSITEVERDTLASLGGTLTELDRLFDASADSGKTAADRLAEAYSVAFDTTTQAGADWVQSTGIDADRIREIFDNTSAGVTESLFGVTTAGQQAFADLAQGAQVQANLIGQSFRTNINGVRGALNTVNLNRVQSAPAANLPAQNNQSNSQDNSELVASVRSLTNQVSAQQEEMRLSRLSPTQTAVGSR